MRYPKELTIAKKSLDEHKAEDISVVDVRSNTPFTDYFLLASATNSRMLNALADAVEEDLSKAGIGVRAKEGLPESGWVIVDAGSVIVHIFSSDKRSEYDLDGLLAHRKAGK